LPADRGTYLLPTPFPCVAASDQSHGIPRPRNAVPAAPERGGRRVDLQVPGLRSTFGMPPLLVDSVFARLSPPWCHLICSLIASPIFGCGHKGQSDMRKSRTMPDLMSEAGRSDGLMLRRTLTHVYLVASLLIKTGDLACLPRRRRPGISLPLVALGCGVNYLAAFRLRPQRDV
jgi:hypothetical protein